MNKKKKLKDPLDALDRDKWLRDILVELDLHDVGNLIDMAEIVTSKESKEHTAALLRQLQPEFMKNIKRGYTYAQVLVPIDDYVNKYCKFDKNALERMGITVKCLSHDNINTCMMGNLIRK